MRILIANYEFPPIGGGASKVSYQLARTLVRQGHQVIVLTSRYGELPPYEVLDGIEVHRVRSRRCGMHDCGVFGALTFLLFALPELRRILNDNQVDVVHYFFGLPTGLLSLYSHGIRRIPYVISLRGSDVPLYDRDSRKLVFLHRLTRGLSHRIWSKAAAVFAVSKGLRQLAADSFPDVPIGVIYNGAAVVAREPRAEDGERSLRLVCVARLIPRKGLHDLFDALATLAGVDWKLTVVGTGPSEESLRRYAETLSIAERIHFAGYCNRDQVRQHYLEADVFVLPTHSEAFANVILEAMAASLPVVASDVGGVAEAVTDGTTGILVPPRSPRLLAAAIRRLAEDATERTRLGSAGQRRIREYFSWDNIAKLYGSVYSEAVIPADLEPQEQFD